MSKLDDIIEHLVIHTANEYGGFEGFEEEGSRDGLDQAKADIKDLILEVFRGVHTYVPDDFQPKLEKVVNDL